MCLQCRRLRFDPWVEKIPWRREWLPTPVFLPGGFQAKRSLAAYSSCGKELKTSDQIGLPRWHSGEESTCQFRKCRRPQRHRFDPWVGKIPWRKKWQTTPVFLAKKFQGQRSLASYSPWGHKQSDLIEQLSTAPQTLRL